MLVGPILTATYASAHSISVGAVVCGCIAATSPPPNDSDLRLDRVAGGRLQYDYTFGLVPGLFVGAALGSETVYKPRTESTVWTGGGVVGGRWGDRTTGGLRLGFGGAEDFGASRASGYYFDFEGEVAHRVGETTALYLALSIFSDRSLTYRTPPSEYTSAWSYSAYILPMMASFGLRFRL